MILFAKNKIHGQENYETNHGLGSCIILNTVIKF
jgi:hypothetical protein